MFYIELGLGTKQKAPSPGQRTPPEFPVHRVPDSRPEHDTKQTEEMPKGI